MRFGIIILFSLFNCAAMAAGPEICASRYSELERSERLRSIKPLFGQTKRIAMVNETKGSYFIIDSLDDVLAASFFTSGLFDLYPIRKDGPLTFCDNGTTLRMDSLGRSEEFQIISGKMQLGDGGPRKTFANGEMPELLKRLHRVDSRGIASQR